MPSARASPPDRIEQSRADLPAPRGRRDHQIVDVAEPAADQVLLHAIAGHAERLCVLPRGQQPIALGELPLHA